MRNPHDYDPIKRTLSPNARLTLVYGCFFLLLLIAPSVALADSISLPLNITGLFPPPGSAPWGTVTLTLNPNASISVNVAMNQGLLAGEFTFNTSLASIAISGQPSNWFLANFPIGACSGDAQFGCFNGWVTTYQLGGVTPNPVSTLSFQVTTPSGFTTVNQLVGLNTFASRQVDFEVLGTTSPGGALSFGVLAAVPEPSSLALLGTGLLGLLGAARRKWHT